MKKYYQITLGLLEKLSKGDQVMKVFGKDTTKKNHFCRVLLLYLKKNPRLLFKRGKEETILSVENTNMKSQQKCLRL